jgi:hypothetical protein
MLDTPTSCVKVSTVPSGLIPTAHLDTAEMRRSGKLGGRRSSRQPEPQFEHQEHHVATEGDGHLDYNGRTPDAYRQELRGFSRQKSMRITTRRLVGAAIWRMPALAKMLRLPTCSSPHVISTPGCVTIA